MSIMMPDAVIPFISQPPHEVFEINFELITRLL